MSESARARRRREQEEDAAELAALERGDIGRPNEPWRPSTIYTECLQSKYATHRFVSGGGGRCPGCDCSQPDCLAHKQRGAVACCPDCKHPVLSRCEFCGRPEIECYLTRA